jgi:hypothetical protein
MTTDVTRWSEAYLAELDRASLTLPADRRAELREQINAHLDAELVSCATDADAQAVLDRLGDPADLVAEAAADLPAPAPTGSGATAAEIIALLLMGIGGVALPLIAPAVGVLFMRSTPRWTAAQVRRTWLILSVGLAALLGGIALATIPNPPVVAGMAALVLIGVIMAVGPVAALYAATRPRTA